MHTLYITIDDGPLLGWSNVLQAVSHEQVPVTLFMVGDHFAQHSNPQEILREIKANPHVLLANHSYYHAHNHYQAFYSDPQVVLEDMQKNKAYLGGGTPNNARLPGRDVFRLPKLSFDDPYVSYAEKEKEIPDYDLLYKKGFHLFGWDHEWAHQSTGQPIQSISKLLAEIKQKFASGKMHVPNHLILLMHDQMFPDHFNGKENLIEFFKAVKAEGYTLKTVDEYPAAL